MAFGFGPFELVILLVILMIFLGVGKLPEVGRAIGKSLRDLRSALQEEPQDRSQPKRDGEEKP